MDINYGSFVLEERIEAHSYYLLPYISYPWVGNWHAHCGASAPRKLAGAPRAGIDEIGTRPLDWKHQTWGFNGICIGGLSPQWEVEDAYRVNRLSSGCACCEDFLPLKCSITKPSASDYVIFRSVLSLSQRHKTSKEGVGWRGLWLCCVYARRHTRQKLGTDLVDSHKQNGWLGTRAMSLPLKICQDYCCTHHLHFASALFLRWPRGAVPAAS